MALSQLNTGVAELDFDQLKDYLSMMSPQQRQQVAAQYKNSPYASIIIPMAMGISQEEQQKAQAMQAQQQQGAQEQPKVVDQAIAQMAPQQLPEDQGIAQLPAQNLAQMADGGIAGYADGSLPQDVYSGDSEYGGPGMAQGGAVERYQSGGSSSPKDKFIAEYGSLAQRVAEDTGIAPELILSQWGLETNWGTKTVGKFNFGNIKDVTGKGPRAVDKAEGSRDAYKTYKSPEDFASDYARLLKVNYPNALNTGSDVGAFAEGLQSGKRGAYATDPSYGKKIAQVATQLMPVSSAQAGEPTRQGPTREQLIAQIPGQAAAGRTTPPESTDRTLLDRIFGAGEAATSMATGLAAIPLGAGRKLLQEAAYGRSDPMADQMARYTFAPRGEAGKEYVEGIAQVAQDLKIPGYVPAATPIGPGLRAATQMGRAGAQADEAAAAAAQAAAPRIPGQLVSDTRVPGEVAVPSTAVPGKPAITNIPTSGEAARQAAALAAQREAAAAAAQRSGAAQQTAAAAKVAGERMGAEGAYTGAAGARANLAGAAGTAAQAAPGAEVPAETPSFSGVSSANEAFRKFERDQQNALVADLTKDQRKDIADAAKETAPTAGKKGWTNEDWVLLGLGLMKSKNPRFLGALGEAGMDVIANKRAVAKEEREEDYRRALTREATAKAKTLESGAGDAAKAVAYADKEFDNWLNSVKDSVGWLSASQEQRDAAITKKRQQLLREGFAVYKIPMPAGVGTPQVAGSQLSPADQALLAKYS